MYCKMKMPNFSHVYSLGSAIAVDTQTISDVYSRLIHNSQCFLLYLDKETPFVDLKNVSDNIPLSAVVISDSL